MSKQSLLLVDGDTRSLRVLEVSLRKAGFMVTAATSVQDALGKLELYAPDLIISETAFPDGDGFELRRRVRVTGEWSEIPFIFLTAEAAIENKIRGLELGVDDYLTKPIYIKEIVTRINILLQKRQRVRFEERRDGRTRFAGRVQDMPVVDVIQTIEISRKSGVIQFVGERGRQAAIYFRDGRVIDAEAGSLQGEDAVYRLLTWSEGEFEVVFRTVRRREVIAMSSQALLMEGMRRLDEWSRLFEQLPSLTHRFEVDTIELAARLGDVPDDNNLILRLFDGKRTLMEVIDASDVGDLECLQAISRLYFEELLLDLDHDSDKPPRRDTGKPMPLAELDGPAPVDDTASGPTAVEAAAAAEGDGSANAAADHAAEAAGSTDAAAEAGPAESEAVADEPVADSVEEPERSGPLMGGFRPSSLRLIDEAVAAAQAIEPSLFEDAPAADAPVSNGVSHPPEVAEADGEIDPDEETPPSGIPAQQMPSPAAAAQLAQMRAAEREDSGLRMIGSLGRDRAEASGELATAGQSRPLRSETARELVTILPRRVTREMPSLSQELAESLPTPTPTPSVLAPKPAVALAVEPPQQRAPLVGSGVSAPARSRLLRLASSVDGGPGLGALLLMVLAAVLAGTAVFLRLRRHAVPTPAPATQPMLQEGSQSPVRPTSGSGSGARLDDGVHDGSAGSTAVEPTAVSKPVPASTDHPAGGAGSSSVAAASIVEPAAPGRATDRAAASSGGGGAASSSSLAARGSGAVSGSSASGRGSAPSGSTSGGGAGSSGSAASGSGARIATGSGAAAGRTASTGSAAAAGRDTAGSGSAAPASAPAAPAVGAAATASEAAAGSGDKPVDKTAEAKALFDQAHSALDESDFAKALELANASLKLRRTARTYLLRAQAEQRLDRIDEALASVDAAAQISPEQGAVWELRGRILWAARRYDEARVAFGKFLQLDPNNPKVPLIQRLMNEPR